MEKQSINNKYLDEISLLKKDVEEYKHKLESQNLENAKTVLALQSNLSYILKYSPSAVAVLDSNLNYLYVSDKYLEDYHIKNENILGEHFYDLFPNLPQKWKESHRKALQGIITNSDDDVFRRADGSVIYTKWETQLQS